MLPSRKEALQYLLCFVRSSVIQIMRLRGARTQIVKCIADTLISLTFEANNWNFSKKSKLLKIGITFF